MMRVRWTMNAVEDLYRITRYIQQDNPQAASQTATAIYEGCEGLARFSHLGEKEKKRGRWNWFCAAAVLCCLPRSISSHRDITGLARFAGSLILTGNEDFSASYDGAMIYARHVWAHLRKDLRLEWRARDSINSMLFFALLVVVVFALAFDPTANPATARLISGGLLWVAILFAAMTTLNQSWAREVRNDVLAAQRMAAASASALFVGKALSNFLFVSGVELALAPVVAVFYNLHPLGQGWLLLLILPLGTWALVINGTFFAALSLRTRNRELLLPLILLPISAPALLAMIQATTAVLTGESEPGLWVRLLVAFDVVFTTLCVLLFDTVLRED